MVSAEQCEVQKVLFMVKLIEKMDDEARYNLRGYVGYRGGPGISPWYTFIWISFMKTKQIARAPQKRIFNCESLDDLGFTPSPLFGNARILEAPYPANYPLNSQLGFQNVDQSLTNIFEYFNIGIYLSSIFIRRFI